MTEQREATATFKTTKDTQIKATLCASKAMKSASACKKALNSLKEAQIYSGKLRDAKTECDSIFESFNRSETESFSANSANTYESQIQQLKVNVKQCWSVISKMKAQKMHDGYLISTEEYAASEMKKNIEDGEKHLEEGRNAIRRYQAIDSFRDVCDQLQEASTVMDEVKNLLNETVDILRQSKDDHSILLETKDYITHKAASMVKILKNIRSTSS